MSDGELVQVDLLETLVAEVRALRGDLQRLERGALNAREAAAFLGISDRTLGTLVRQGRIRIAEWLGQGSVTVTRRYAHVRGFNPAIDGYGEV